MDRNINYSLPFKTYVAKINDFFQKLQWLQRWKINPRPNQDGSFVSHAKKKSEYLISVYVILKVFNLAPSGGKTIGNLGNPHISDHLKLNFWNTSPNLENPWHSLGDFPFHWGFPFFLLWVSPRSHSPQCGSPCLPPWCRVMSTVVTQGLVG